MRAVPDANVLVSAALSPTGRPAQLLSAWRAGDLELVVCERLLAETERALAYPRVASRLPADQSASFVALIRTEAAVADDPMTIPPRSRDPHDDYLLALAETTRSILVTGDADLLALADRFPVWTVGQLLTALTP